MMWALAMKHSEHSNGPPCSCQNHEAEKKGQSPAWLLCHALENATHYLPAQGPIGVFVHHNTLHAFQHMPFEKAVIKAAEIFGAEPYLAEQTYQNHRKNGRILDQDIDAVLAREPDVSLLNGRLTRNELRRVLLIPGVRRVNHGNLTWQIEEGNFLKQFRSDLPPTSARALASDQPEKLWSICTNRYKVLPEQAERQPSRPADVMEQTHGINLDDVVNPILVRVVSSYLDQGLAYWPMPAREDGLLGASCALFTATWLSDLPVMLRGIRAEFSRLSDRTAEDAVLHLLTELGVAPQDWDAMIRGELLALPGWAGMIHCLEVDPLLAPHERPSFSLMDFLAVRLALTVVVLRNVDGSTTAWRNHSVTSKAHHDPLTHQARLFDACQLLGYHSELLAELSEEEFNELCPELDLCHEWERRRLLHLAYELRHERQILIPMSRHRAMPAVVEKSDRLEAQVIFCIDEREESIRRALEEVEPLIETYGAAGFFGCAVDYTGLDDPHGVSLCPVVVKPAHQVAEVPVEEDHGLGHIRQKARRSWAKLTRVSNIGSRTLVRGTISTACLGFFSLFPMAFRILAPLRFANIMGKLSAVFLPEPRTELQFMRNDDESRHATTGLLSGFSISEMADRVANMLNPMGMTIGHARLVVVLGHGSSSLNNPFVSAYCCGACGGRSGAPNARLFALMANNPEVRQLLHERGVHLPEDTWFLGGYHDTCSDEIQLFDTDLMPQSHVSDLVKLRGKLDESRARAAHERTRRFEAFDNHRSIQAALRHVQERSVHLGEPRPEYGHCTNAVAVVGRRATTQGLFLDRRAFLVSYDVTNDPENRYLAALLGAVIPVCGGINLEYYFSTVDNERYGCGTKLPHNISGLLGVMNGYQSDLRTGLPLQTVEIHEPVRILFVVETTKERVLSVIHANPLLTEFLENQWIRLAVIDPDDGLIEIYRGNGSWEKLSGDEEPLPVAHSSIEYYRGKRDHLPLARICPKLQTSA
jgi:uncharacterized protein YbcC (UPF0753/DUF2309 family)